MEQELTVHRTVLSMCSRHEASDELNISNQRAGGGEGSGGKYSFGLSLSLSLSHCRSHGKILHCIQTAGLCCGWVTWPPVWPMRGGCYDSNGSRGRWAWELSAANLAVWHMCCKHGRPITRSLASWAMLIVLCGKTNCGWHWAICF